MPKSNRPYKQPKRPYTYRFKKGGDGRGRRILRGLMKALVLATIWGGLALAVIIGWYAQDMPDIRQVVQPQRRPAITILADDGQMIVRYGDMFGKHVKLSEVPKNLTSAILAIEDRRFYSHFGIDVFGLLRAFASNVRAGHVVQGGSTITQQLAKNLFLSPDRTFKRKVQEMLLAFWLERRYEKDQILTAYLNRVYFGAGAYGVDAAAETYFGKPVGSLTLRESAMLAGVLRAPSKFSPMNNPTLANARANIVIEAMADAGFIEEWEKNDAKLTAPLPRRKPGSTTDGRYFADWVVDQIDGLLENTPQDLVISTTLDLSLQRMAERHVNTALATDKNQDVTQGALITLAPDGAVRALVGGRDYDESQFNRATQALRQPGSAFKPVVYLAALQEGMTPDEIFDDAPISVGHWSPENYDGAYRGPITAREALAQSINTVAVRVLQRAGILKVIDTARALGVASPIGHDLSLALGSNEMTPLELTGVYASIAADGRMITPYAIKEIRNRAGEVLYRRPDANPPTTVSPNATATLVDMMTEVVRSGTGRRAALDRPVAGKTGTSSNYHDAWFLGFTGNYVTGVWLGNDDNKPMKKVTGGSLPAALWHDYMVDAEAKLPPRELLANASSQPFEQIGTTINNTAETVTDTLGEFIKSLTGN